MCKSTKSQEKATSNFFEKLRGEAYRKPRAIFEVADDGRADLIGFAAHVDGILNFFRVMPDESVRCDGLVSIPAMGNRGIAAYYGGDYAVAI